MWWIYVFKGCTLKNNERMNDIIVGKLFGQVLCVSVIESSRNKWKYMTKY